MCDISFLIPSIKPYESYGKRVIDSIYQADNKYKFEILYCSPYEIEDKRIKYIHDNKRLGSIPALNEMFQNYSNGQYLVILTDDHLVSTNIFDVIPFLENKQIFGNRNYNICTLASTAPCYLPPTFGPLWTEEDIKLPPYIVMRFPVINRDTLIEHMDSHIFHPEFKNHFGDNYLSYFLGENGEPGVECSNISLFVMPESIEWQRQLMHYEELFHDKAAPFYKESYLTCIDLLRRYKKGMPYVC